MTAARGGVGRLLQIPANAFAHFAGSALLWTINQGFRKALPPGFTPSSAPQAGFKSGSKLTSQCNSLRRSLIFIKAVEDEPPVKRIAIAASFFLVLICAPTVYGQQNDPAAREQTRTRLAQLLEKAGPEVKIAFTRSQKQPFNYVGSLKTGLVNADSFEVVVSVTAKDTIGFRV